MAKELTSPHTPQGEIILYQPDETIRLEVRLEDDTVWLSQQQMTELFNATKQNISLHIKNIYEEGELGIESTVKEYLTVREEGNRIVRRRVNFYNLDVIISVGYRVRWSTSIVLTTASFSSTRRCTTLVLPLRILERSGSLLP